MNFLFILGKGSEFLVKKQLCYNEIVQWRKISEKRVIDVGQAVEFEGGESCGVLIIASCLPSFIYIMIVIIEN